MLLTIDSFYSGNLESVRSLWVFLPPGYRRHNRRYPVLYLQDGQRLFSRGAPPGARQWEVDETASKLMKAGLIEPIIIVGIAHGVSREYDYTPTFDQEEGTGGGADLYLSFMIEEVKPFVDEHFRTRPARADTAIGGSSLGGLLALYAGLAMPDRFGKIAALSPSLWWDDYFLLKLASSWEPAPGTVRPRIWLDMGTAEEDEENGELMDENSPDDDDSFEIAEYPEEELFPLEQTEILMRILRSKGYRRGRNLRYFIGLGATHDEYSWGSRFDQVLRFLFPIRKRK